MTALAAQPRPRSPAAAAPPALTLRESVEIVTRHQRWRRGEIDEQMHCARLLGRALDRLLDHARDALPAASPPTLGD